MDWLTDPNAWAAFAALAALEIVLGVDNVIFISLVAERLPDHQARRARILGLGLALLMRIGMLAAIAWIVGLTATLFTLFGREVSWRDLILIAGGLFLLVKGTLEIHHSVEGGGAHAGAGRSIGFGVAIAQIVALDLIFSLDSVITAVGMAEDLAIMVAAVVVAILVMLAASDAISRFIRKRPTAKMLALSFLLLVGVALVADGMHFHIPRGYLYFAIAFSAMVEGLNILAQSRRNPRAG